MTKHRLFTIAAGLSLAIAVTLALLWSTQEGQFYTRYTQRHQHDVWIVRGRISYAIHDLVWPPPTSPFGKSVLGTREIFDVPMWPFIAGALVLPAIWVIRWKRRKPSAARGFEVQATANRPPT
jgi:hypothetical protein